MKLKNILKLFGYDLGKPLQVIMKLAPDLFGDKLKEDLEEYFHKHLTDARRKEVVEELRLAALQLEKNNSVGAAVQIMKILKGIKL